ncbi:MAG: VWA domain-containing protein [Planctomycetota bacterium]
MILIYLVILLWFGTRFVLCDNDDYKNLFTDTTYKNYWARFYTLQKICKNPDKYYKTLLLAYEHKEEPIFELASHCLSQLKDRNNINDFIKNYIDGIKSTHRAKDSLTILARLSHKEVIERLDKLNDSLKSVALNALLETKLDDKTVNIVKKFLKSKSDEVKINVLKILIKAKSIDKKEIMQFLKTTNKALKFQSLRALCLVDKEQCSDILIKESATKNNVELCNLINIVKDYGLEDIYESILKDIDNTKDFLKKKIVFSGLPVLNDDRFKEVILKYWKELSTNFLSLLFNVYLKKFNESPEEITLEKVYKVLSERPQEGFRTSGIPVFFTLPVYGKKIVFIIDMSGSMARKVKGSNVTKFELAQKELEKVLNDFGPDIKFNIILINSETDKLKLRQFSPNLVPTRKDEIKKAMNYLNNAWEKLQEVKRGRSDIYDALSIALNIPELDTIILLTDGNPTWGKYTLRNNILREITLQNMCKLVSINAIATGAGKEGYDFLKRLSLDNFGIFKKVKED